MSSKRRVEKEETQSHVTLSSALQMLNIGYGNLIATARVIAILSPQGAPMRRLRDEASSRGKLVDATQGRRTRSILVTDSDHIILTAVTPDTIAARLSPSEITKESEGV